MKYNDDEKKLLIKCDKLSDEMVEAFRKIMRDDNCADPSEITQSAVQTMGTFIAKMIAIIAASYPDELQEEVIKSVDHGFIQVYKSYFENINGQIKEYRENWLKLIKEGKVQSIEQN